MFADLNNVYVAGLYISKQRVLGKIGTNFNLFFCLCLNSFINQLARFDHLL